MSDHETAELLKSYILEYLLKNNTTIDKPSLVIIDKVIDKIDLNKAEKFTYSMYNKQITPNVTPDKLINPQFINELNSDISKVSNEQDVLKIIDKISTKIATEINKQINTY